MADIRDIAGIETLVRPAAKKGAGTVVFFHGFGADMNDLYPLAEMMDPQEQLNWYFPNGILDVVIAPGFRGRAWYPVNMRKLEELMRQGQTADLSEMRPDGLDNAITHAKDFMGEISKLHKNILIGGFSQGAMLCTELACKLPTAPVGVVLMSAGFIDKNLWTQILPQRTGIPYVQSHGTNDAILSFDAAKKLNALLNKSGWRGDFVSFTGGHEIPPPVLTRVSAFIQKQFR